MAYQSIFKRYELKYMLTREQKKRLVAAMEPYMALDAYGRTTIRNLYFDTDNYRLIRRSMEHPAYKEKLRIRSYDRADAESPVFVELKKKYESVVYKRRILLPEQEAMGWICERKTNVVSSQISAEIEYVLDYYENLHPTVFLSYEREAYYTKTGEDFRVTFDEHILCRQEELSLEEEAWGTPILEEGKVLMELKSPGGIPLWMTHLLTKEHVYKTPFSKYGEAYRTLIYPKLKEGKNDESI